MSTALYRRYRPESFADVIGQEHVTEPLMQALRTGRFAHAYLFSGPRGCGKTTSARILARCLNCEQGPTATPCGTCESCIALARGGSGSVDVIEIDAASHGGVDDARELRERASYGPAQSRYKVYIIDEAHMVTPQGFNALLKIVEEPPEHVKFVFATTEPEKVIGTIRSRTHHYPFRLVPPGLLSDYMQGLCEQEGVPVEPGVLSFVTRAGGGSVRDSLSVLDQLIAGSSAEGLTYAGAAALLGFTDGELLDAVIDAFAAGDGAAVFRQIDKVIESGHDPRRFIEDLLERLRDLIVVAAVPDGAGQVLRHVPEDQLERMRQQSAAFGTGALSRAADIANTGLTEMTGATAPRLQLELIAARILLPAASGEQGYAARLDRLERRLELGEAVSGPRSAGSGGGGRIETPSSPRSAGSGGGDATIGRPPAGRFAPTGGLPPDPASAAATAPGSALAEHGRGGEPSREQAGRGGEPPRDDNGGRVGRSASGGRIETGEPSEASAVLSGPERAEGVSEGRPEATLRPVGDDGWPEDRPPQDVAQAQSPVSSHAEPPLVEESPLSDRPVDAEPDPPPARALGAIDTDAVRRAWPDVLDAIFKIKRVTWTLLSQHAQVVDYDGQRLLLGTSTQGLADAFRRGQHPEVVRQALVEQIGVDCQVEAVVHAGASGGGTPPPGAATPSGKDHGAAQPRSAPVSQPSPAPGDWSASAPRPPANEDATRLGGAAPPGGWDADTRDSWSSPAGPPPDWATAAPPGDSGPAEARGGQEVPGAPDSGTSAGGATEGGASAGAGRDERAERERSPVDVAHDKGAEPEPSSIDAAHDIPAGGAGVPAGAPGQSEPPADSSVAGPPASARRRAEQRLRERSTSDGPNQAGADDSAADYDDESIEDAGAAGLPVIQSVLGGIVIAEESDS